MLAILVVVYAVNFIDRQILSILLQPIKEELGASDLAMGLLTGFAFAVFYTFAGIPIARLADRGSRRAIMAVGIAFWSVLTALSGAARSFGALALARIGVGIGEASATPAAHSLISDYFPPERRTRALAIYNVGSSLGILFGLALGGWLKEVLGWRLTFAVVGLPGLLVALLVWVAVPEPQRGLSEARADSGRPPDLFETLDFLTSQRSYLHVAFAAALYACTGYGLLAWAPTFLVRVHGLGYAEVGWKLGLIIGISSAVGVLVAGALCDRLARRDVRWLVWIPALSTALLAPFYAVFALAPQTNLALLAYIPVNLATAVFAPPSYAIAQGLAQLRMRALASALMLFVINLIGLGLGPTLVGALSDAFAPRFGAESLRYALLLALGLTLWGSLHSVLAGRSLARDLARSAASN
ncbi:MAG TPA: MFS transporter [Myxococcota bacterium]|nr:MFS transporter [Myxococcota bacterium]